MLKYQPYLNLTPYKILTVTMHLHGIQVKKYRDTDSSIIKMNRQD